LLDMTGELVLEVQSPLETLPSDTWNECRHQPLC
jgi:hypothetical protein